MLKFEDLVVDPEFEALLPALSPEEFKNLEQSILKNGLLDPIKVWEEPDTGRHIIIDGHNRYKILKKNSIYWDCWNSYKYMYQDELPTRDDVKKWMLEQQLGRRNLSDIDKYEITQKFKSVYEKRAKENQSAAGKGLTNLSKVNTREEMAKAVGVSEGTYQKMDAVMKSDNPDLKEQLKAGEISVHKAYQEVRKRESSACKNCGDPKEHIEQDKELKWLEELCQDFIGQVSGAIEKMDKDHIEKVHDILGKFESDVSKLYQRVEEESSKTNF